MYDVGEEREVGILDGEPVYRRVWDFTLTVAANTQSALFLSSANESIDRLVQVGGSWETGRERETYFMSPWITTTPPYGLVLLGSTGRFELYTRSPVARNDARVLVWYDYTKGPEDGNEDGSEGGNEGGNDLAPANQADMTSQSHRLTNLAMVEIPIEERTKLLSQ